MTVYAIVHLNVHDRATYDRYVERFMPVFDKFNGAVLAADDHPTILQGQSDTNRVVLLSFPDKKSFFNWSGSVEYQEIAKDRAASSNGLILLVEGLS